LSIAVLLVAVPVKTASVMSIVSPFAALHVVVVVLTDVPAVNVAVTGASLEEKKSNPPCATAAPAATSAVVSAAATATRRRVAILEKILIKPSLVGPLALVKNEHRVSNREPSRDRFRSVF
jgi:hypothetical protein